MAVSVSMIGQEIVFQIQWSVSMDSTPNAQEPKGDIVAWLRRRAGNDMVCIPGNLAGEIADHIEALATGRLDIDDEAKNRAVVALFGLLASRGENPHDATLRRMVDLVLTAALTKPVPKAGTSRDASLPDGWANDSLVPLI
jgi:beta-glucosidase-like glycosyl hydrolase